MKRFIAALVAVILLMTSMTVTAWADEDGNTEPAPTESQTPPETPTETPTPTPAPQEPSAGPSDPPETPSDPTPVPSDSAQPDVPTQTPTEPTDGPGQDSETPTAAPTQVTGAPDTQAPTDQASQQPSPGATAEETPEPTEAPVALAVSLTTPRYAFVKRIAVTAQVSVTGGTAPYKVSINVRAGGKTVGEHSASCGANESVSYSYMPANDGTHTVSVTVVDALGAKISKSANVPVAKRDYANRAQWDKRARNVKRTGGWREDVVAIARSQVGYRESEIDFRIEEDGSVSGYTMYGSDYGSTYGEWCAMFVTWCLKKADISNGDFPYAANCSKWKASLRYRGAYEDDEDHYRPRPGDLVFFCKEDKKTNVPTHVGIVEKVEGDVITTIEGNSYKSVLRKKYRLSNREIVGYANMGVLMRKAGVPEVLPDMHKPLKLKNMLPMGTEY